MSKKNKKNKMNNINTETAETNTETDENWDDQAETEENWDDFDDDASDDDASEEEDLTEEPVSAQDDDQDVPAQESVQVDVDPEDTTAFPPQYYTTSVDYDDGGKTIPAGTQIQVKCDNCAVWETPLAARDGKPLCKPGTPIQVETSEGEERKWRMAAHRFSCQNYFVPKDLEDVLTYVTNDVEYVRCLAWAFPAIEAFCKLQDRIRAHAEKNGLGDQTATIDSVAEFLLLFRTQEQAQYIKPFIKYVYKNLKAKSKPKSKTSKSSFQPGAEVEWDDLGSGQRVSGTIRTVGGPKKLITLLVSGESAASLKPKYAEKWQAEHEGESISNLVIHVRYSYNEWKEERNPAVKSEAVVFDFTEDV